MSPERHVRGSRRFGKRIHDSNPGHTELKQNTYLLKSWTNECIVCKHTPIPHDLDVPSNSQ